MKKHILLVEDERDISDVMRAQLEIQGHNVYQVFDGEEALGKTQSSDIEYDLFILDRMLPGKDGVEICKFLRMFEKTKETPILMVTALTQADDIVVGLESGADDYITKPFDMKIFMARVKALLRRSNRKMSVESNDETLQVKNLKIDIGRVKAFVSDEEVELTKSEFKLLSALVECAGKVLTRKRLVEIVQDGPVHVTDRTIDTHVFGLRKKLGTASDLVETIRGIGYRIITE